MCFNSFLVVAAAAACLCGVVRSENNKTYYLSNADSNMFFCLSTDVPNDIKLTHGSTGVKNCVTIAFNIQPHNNGLVFLLRSGSECHHMCMDSCGTIYHTNKYVESECKWTTIAFKTVDTLSQRHGNVSHFLATSGYYLLRFTVADLQLQSFQTYLNFKISPVAAKTQQCVLNTKNEGTPKKCVEVFKRSTETMDTHADYGAVNLFDKLLAFLGFYTIGPPKTAKDSLRMLDYENNYYFRM
ncbi:FGF-1 [Betabaculovirus altermyunipunctae]|uniref:FGF-1 n=1 Tax=Betabaculovirus altermyunipunctae TaxID=3051996 RepID=A0A1S5YE95_9BBAC|nr:FGF-1 [Betabaculovirus altermyunipunctae]AQQ80344.1 FGF-1 [Betabaculovirus altermyunipunctae]